MVISRLNRCPVLLPVLILLAFTAVGCVPSEPEMITVTEVIRLGEEQIVITRLAEPTPTPTATPVPPEIVEQPVKLELASTSDLPDLDPQHATTDSHDLVENLFVGLTRFNYQTQRVEPELAVSWNVSSDGLTWTFDLREDISWAKPADPPDMIDQTWELEPVRPVLSWDVVRAVQRACDRETGTPEAFMFFIIEGCETVYRSPEVTEELLDAIGAHAVDDHTLEIRLTEPASYFLTMTALPQLRPVPGELIEEHGSEWRTTIGELADGWQTPEYIYTSGPFLPSAETFNDEALVLYRNPLWPINGPGNVAVVEISLQQDEMEIFEAWQAKRLDLSPIPVSEREAFLSLSPTKAQLITNQTVFYVGFNLDSPVFGEPEARRAFAAAIDREELIDTMFEGRAQELKHFSPPGAVGAPPVDEVGVGYSPDYARQQIDRTSFRNCKLIPPITFLVSTADLSLLQAELLRSMWISELSCDEKLIPIVQTDFGTLLSETTRAAPTRPDLWELAWPPTYPDAHNLLFDLLHCSDGENRQNRACSEVDRLLRQASVTTEIEEREVLYREAERLLFGEDGLMPLIPLYVRGEYLLVQNWLTHTPALSGGEQYDTYIIDNELKRLEQSRDQQ